jgi:argininosuccinate synthase
VGVTGSDAGHSVQFLAKNQGEPGVRYQDLVGKHIGGAVSGGLDSCTATMWLRERGAMPHCFTVDLGQPDESNLDDVPRRMLASGAVEAIVIPGQKALATAGLQVIQAQARYEGGYWNTTGIARYITTALIIRELQKRSIDVLFHGATGRGNDQVRFQLATNMLAPRMRVYAPWRDQAFIDQFGGRAEMLAYCAERNLPVKQTVAKPYSTDANFLGLTHEAGKLESLHTPAAHVEPGMGVWAWDAPDRPEIISIRWKKGVPTAINGVPVSLVDAFNQANKIGGRNGVGIGAHVVENRFVGIKSRGVYEAPGMEILGQSYAFLLQLILDRRARDLFESVSKQIATQIYQGFWYDLATTGALAALGPILSLMNGTISLRLYKGNVFFEDAEETTQSLYSEDIASMERIGSFDHADSEGFLNVLGVSARNYADKQFEALDREEIPVQAEAKPLVEAG